MQDVRDLREDKIPISWAALIYYAVMLIAFFIGLYGLFSLIRLSGESLTQSQHALTSLF